MSDPPLLVPVLLLIVAPGLVLAWRLGWLAARRSRWVISGLTAAVTLAAMPWQGTEFETIKRIHLVLATAAAALLGVEALARRWQHRPHRRTIDALLLILTALAVLNHFNYGAFRGHGVRAWTHLHDVGHYYLGAKYAAELGYADLYTAVLRAEVEDLGGRVSIPEARDLATYRRVPSADLVRASDSVKAAFSPDRWFDFKRDAHYFRERLGDHHQRFLLDHGFNPTPVWTLFGSTLANRVPAGSAAGVFALSLIDPLLLLATFAAVAWAFGRRVTLLAVLCFTVTHGATFGWVGGAFLRFGWFWALITAACCLRRRHFASAGALLALAAGLRVFPIFFLLPLVGKAVATVLRRAERPWRQRLPGRYLRLLSAAAITGAALFAVSGLGPRGFAGWPEFHANMGLHTANISPNVVGLTEVLAHGWTGSRMVTQEEFDALKERRQAIHRVQLAVVLVPLSILVARLVRRRSDLDAMALGAPLLLSAVGLAGYYTVFLVLVVLAFRRSPAALATIFAVEATCWLLRVYEDRDGRLYVYRSVALGWLYLMLWLPSRRRGEP